MGEGERGGECFEGVVVEDIFADLGIIATFARSIPSEETGGCQMAYLQ